MPKAAATSPRRNDARPKGSPGHPPGGSARRNQSMPAPGGRGPGRTRERDLAAASGPHRPKSHPAIAKAPPRKFERMDGFSMLPPDPEMHKDLVRRQRIADKARPKPKAEDIRCCEVLDPTGATLPEEERDAARQRWIAEMQARADPKAVRRAAREREEKLREEEREEERARRQEFEQQWYEREAASQALQAQLTAVTNAAARDRWASTDLPIAAFPAAAEAVMPPEGTDLAAVRRKMASERAGRGAAIVANAGHVLAEVALREPLLKAEQRLDALEAAIDEKKQMLACVETRP
eukprot:TRINITY_DN25351_c0_g1_i1.p1 TRINITY_DN25351_c0_g1~~TRINITY_DN25351_c0_g1_i1.p1  ORF type:complete len:328 (-),score=61.02 TRINITY_DN25351_c0_g1_i1:34-915(-)